MSAALVWFRRDLRVHDLAANGRFIHRDSTELTGVPQKFIHASWKMSAAEQAACDLRIGRDYPAPVVDHAAARSRILA